MAPRDGKGRYIKSGAAAAPTAPSPMPAPSAAPAPQAPQVRERIDIRLTRRDYLDLPSRLRKPGFRQRIMRMGDSPSETEARIEEMEEMGYTVVRNKDGSPVQRRNGLLVEIPQELYQARQRAKAEANERANRAQGQANREQLNARLRGIPLPPGAASGVLESDVDRGPAEELVKEGEFATPLA